MRLPFSHDRRPAPPAAAGPAVRPAIRPAIQPAIQPVPPPPPPPPAEPEPPQIDLVSRAFELANDDWTEQEAAVEMARLAGGDRARLLEVYEQLVARLIRTAVIDSRGVRATRVVSRATRLVSTGG